MSRKALDPSASAEMSALQNVPTSSRPSFQDVPSAARVGQPRAPRPSEMRQDVPECSSGGPPCEKRGTNPNGHSGASVGKTQLPRRPQPLTTRQRAAIRLLVRGARTCELSHLLGVERHTIARWKRNPLFAAELQRIERDLTEATIAAATAISIAQTRSVRPSPMRPSSERPSRERPQWPPQRPSYRPPPPPAPSRAVPAFDESEEDALAESLIEHILSSRTREQLDRERREDADGPPA